MVDGQHFSEDRAKLAPNEFRLLLKFKPSQGEAARVFKFYQQWLVATSQIINDFVSHVHRGMHISIRLVEMKEGSADPKFSLDPMLVTTGGQKPIPEGFMNGLLPMVQEIVSSQQDFLMGSVGDDNYHLFYQQKLQQLNQLASQYKAELSDAFGEPLSPGDSTNPNLEDTNSKSPKKDPKPVAFKKGTVFNALTQIADATSQNLLPEEKVVQRAADGEETVFTPELMRESKVHEDLVKTTDKKHREQEIVAVRAVLHGKGAWSFLWNGRVKSMEIKDPNWNARFKAGEVSLVSDQRLKADIKEENISYSKMGVEYKRRNRFTITKVY